LALHPKYVERLRQLVGPRSFLEDHAEDGNLRQYLEEFLKDRWENDWDFRIEMMMLMMKYAKEPVPELDFYYLEHLQNTMNIFMESIRNVGHKSLKS
jgi:hypothetical protein